MLSNFILISTNTCNSFSDSARYKIWSHLYYTSHYWSFKNHEILVIQSINTVDHQSIQQGFTISNYFDIVRRKPTVSIHESFPPFPVQLITPNRSSISNQKNLKVLCSPYWEQLRHPGPINDRVWDQQVCYAYTFLTHCKNRTKTESPNNLCSETFECIHGNDLIL